MTGCMVLVKYINGRVGITEKVYGKRAHVKFEETQR